MAYPIVCTLVHTVKSLHMIIPHSPRQQGGRLRVLLPIRHAGHILPGFPTCKDHSILIPNHAKMKVGKNIRLWYL